MIDYTVLDSYVFDAVSICLSIGVILGAIFAFIRKVS